MQITKTQPYWFNTKCHPLDYDQYQLDRKRLRIAKQKWTALTGLAPTKKNVLILFPSETTFDIRNSNHWQSARSLLEDSYFKYS